jgi:hypothetical protein
MTQQEKREKETHLFANKLNQDKSYFKGFAAKFEGIAEAESVDEMSVVQNQQELQEEQRLAEVPHQTKSDGDPDESNSDEDEEDGDEEDAEKKGTEADPDLNSGQEDQPEEEAYEFEQDDELHREEEERKAELKRLADENNDINNYYGEDGLLKDQNQKNREESYRMPEKPQAMRSSKAWRKLEIKKILST